MPLLTSHVELAITFIVIHAWKIPRNLRTYVMSQVYLSMLGYKFAVGHMTQNNRINGRLQINV